MELLPPDGACTCQSWHGRAIESIRVCDHYRNPIGHTDRLSRTRDRFRADADGDGGSTGDRVMIIGKLLYKHRSEFRVREEVTNKQRSIRAKVQANTKEREKKQTKDEVGRLNAIND
jgi:hypothetical protein